MMDDNTKTYKKGMIAGCLMCVLVYLPMILRGADIRILIHDEFDGEFLTYILQAKHFFDDNIPELFNGASKTAMTPPAPGMVSIFAFLPSDLALFFIYIGIAAIAFIGMFWCVIILSGKEWIAAATGVMYASLPFYPVYGLSVMGQPLLILAFWMLYNKRKIALAYIIIAFFVINSSLVLIGYADIIIVSIVIIYMIIKRHTSIKLLFFGLVEMIAGYSLLNMTLIKEVLFSNSGFKSHKEEFISSGNSPLASFKEYFINGVYHANAKQTLIVFFSTIVLAICIILYKRLSNKEKRKTMLLMSLLCLAILISAFAAFWGWAPIGNFRSSIGGPIQYFQLDRFYWLFPTIWYIVLAITVDLLSNYSLGKKVATVFIIANFAFILYGSTIEANLKMLVKGRYDSLGHASVEEFYQPKMFEEADRLIGNKNKSNYRVCSIGLYPAIALYNGYYCIDGYSNNYSLDYKHRFRKIIDGELEKNEDLRKYYDEWGNRCYVFSNDLGRNYYCYKRANLKIEDLDLNTEAMREMGCKYVFSAVPIYNFDEFLLLGKVTSETSTYDLYVFEIM